MIKYRLACTKGHAFDAWFKSSVDYDRQARRGLVVCPDCGSHKVAKAIMAPRVARRDRGEASPVRTANAPAAKAAAPEAEVLAMMRKVRATVLENAENVGPRFAEEARKIHYEETEPRGIYGEASPVEVKELHEEGIECYPLPRLPEDQN